MTLNQIFKALFRRCTGFSVLSRKPVRVAIAISLVWIIIGGSVASGETFLRTWGSFGSGDGEFNSPFGLAVAGDEVFVVNFNHRVQVFDRSGTVGVERRDGANMRAGTAGAGGEAAIWAR